MIDIRAPDNFSICVSCHCILNGIVCYGSLTVQSHILGLRIWPWAGVEHQGSHVVSLVNGVISISNWFYDFENYSINEYSMVSLIKCVAMACLIYCSPCIPIAIQARRARIFAAVSVTTWLPWLRLFGALRLTWGTYMHDKFRRPLKVLNSEYTISCFGLWGFLRARIEM